MSMARQLPTYILEPTNQWAGTSGYEARKIYRDAETITHYSSAATMFQAIGDDLGTAPSTGGRIECKNGLYVIDTDIGAGNYHVKFSNNTDGAGIHIDLIGETRNNTIIRNSVSSGSLNRMFGFNCNTNLENITFDVNGVGTETACVVVESDATGKIGARVNNCKFMKHTGMGFQTYKTDWAIVTNNRFENTGTAADDQCALVCHEYGMITNNMFDKTVGEPIGSCLTFGECNNAVIANNVIVRPSNCYNGISLEAFGDYHDVNVCNNVLTNGNILIGATGTWAYTFKRININNNTLNGGDIQILGPDSGSHTTQMKDINVEGNWVQDAQEGGIRVFDAAGPTVIRNNFIRNTNMSGSNPGAPYNSAINLRDGNKIICERNNIWMDSNGDPDVNPNGIRFENIVDYWIQNNRIINLSANPSYTNGGGNSGTQIISKSL